jgi:phage gpG-like protein
MAGTSISIKDEATPMLHHALKLVKDFSVPLRLTAQYLIKCEARQFESEGSADGTPWAPLSPKTIIRRRKGRKPGIKKILQDTRHMLSSIIGKNGDSIFELDANSLRMGTNVRYARIQRYGGIIMRTVKPGVVRLRKLRSGRVQFASNKYIKKGGAHTVVAYTGDKQYQISIPARPFLVMTTKKIDYITNVIFTQYMVKKGIL